MKTTGQKAKLLVLQRIFLEQTDAEHPITAPRLVQMLADEGIAAERKCIYDDIETLQRCGLDIEHIPGPRGGYYVASRDFELPELRMLVDAVQSSRFLTEKKSMQMIGKLERQASRYEAAQLQQQVFVANRIKTMNESIYYNVDRLHDAIAHDVQISFEYFEWTIHKEKELRHNGRRYVVSPWALIWDNENYYLVAYDEAYNDVRHYRVDKMLRIQPLDQPRIGKDKTGRLDVAAYAGQRFGMYGGESESVTLECDASLAGVVIDRFGADVPITAGGEGTFHAHVQVTVSPVFLAWVISLGGRARIVAPISAVEKLRQAAETALSVHPG